MLSDKLLRDIGIWTLHKAFHISLREIARQIGSPHSNVRRSHKRAFTFLDSLKSAHFPYK